MTDISVVKLNIQNQETWRYSGTLLRNDGHEIFLEANFNRADMPFHGILLRQGDRFEETYYTDRWYNIFEIHDRDTDEIKGWYCNVTYPARLKDRVLEYIDLALDLLVYPDGRQLVLDEDEFAELHLAVEIEQQARAALAELQALFAAKNFQPAKPRAQGSTR